MKKQKETVIKSKKIGRPIKEFLPTNLQNPPREQIPFKTPEIYIRDYKLSIKPCTLPKEWPSDEEALKFDFGVFNISEKFCDPENNEINIPYSILIETFGEIKWLRPEEYIREFILDKEIRLKMPDRNPIKMRKKLAEKYLMRQLGQNNSQYVDSKNLELTEIDCDEFNLDKYLKSKAKKSKTGDSSLILMMKDAFDEYADAQYNKEFYKYFENIYNFKIVTTIERELSSEEIANNNQEIEIKIKDASNAVTKLKKGNISTTTTVENNINNKFKDCAPSDILMIEKYPKYTKWIASIFQVIKDMNIKDAYNNESIYKKIYPQKDGVPIYNPHGRYWVKLFYMGKYRKIEIDDTMPCGKYDEFLLPQCESLEELWPALLTKALLKLFSHKFIGTNFQHEQIGDCSIIKALTRYVGEKLELDLSDLENFGYISNDSNYVDENEIQDLKIIKKLLSSEAYQNSQKFLIAFNKSEELNDFNAHPLRVHEIDDENESSSLKNLNSERTKQGSVLGNIFNKKSDDDNEEINYDNTNDKYKDSNSETKRKMKKNTIINSSKAKRNTLGHMDLLKNCSNFISPMILSKQLSMNNIDSNNLKKDGKFLSSIKTMLFKNILTSVFSSKPNPYQNRFNNLIKSSIHLALVNNDKNKKINNNKNRSNRLAYSEITNSNSNSDINYNKNLPRSTKDMIQINNSTQLYIDYAYSIVEYFYNNEFNMRRIKPVDYSDLRKKIQDLKVSYKTLPKEQKKHYAQNLKEMEHKSAEEKSKRLEELKNPGKNFYLIKLKTNCIDYSNKIINLYFPFKNEEIEMAKKCILNKWMYPSISFFEGTFEEPIGIDTSQISEVNEKYTAANTNIGPTFDESFWTKNFYTNKILDSNLDIYENPQEPLKRQDGLWIDMKDFCNMFYHFIALHNTKFYPYSIEIDNNWYNFENDFYQPDYNFFVFHLTPPGNGNNKNLNTILSNNKYHPDKEFLQKDSSKPDSCFLIYFESNSFSNENLNNNHKLSDLKSYLILDLVDFKGDSVILNETISLNSYFTAFQYDKILADKEYFIIIKGGLVPFGYYLKILSEHSIANMSYDHYLKTYRDYNSFNFSNIQFPTCEENKSYIITKFKITIDNISIIQILSNKFPDAYLKQFIEIYLIQEDFDSLDTNPLLDNNKRRIYFNLDINFNYLGTYFIVFSINPSFNIQEFLFDIEIITNNKNSKIEIIDMIDPFEISEQYLPLKHGVIFKELIYVPLETVLYTSIEISLKIKQNDKYKNLNLVKDKLKIKMEICRFDKVILSGEFYETTLIHNLVLNNIINSSSVASSMISFVGQGGAGQLGNTGQATNNNPKAHDTNKKQNPTISSALLENNPFSIICYIDETESSSFIKYAENNSQIFWILRVFSSDSIAIVRNTIKEEKERMLIESWDRNDPGRSVRSNKARIIFLLQLKKQKGNLLTIEEEDLLSEIRPRKINKNIGNVVHPNPTLIVDNKKDQKNNTNVKEKSTKNIPVVNNKDKSTINVPTVVVNQVEIPLVDLNRILPTPESHKSILYKNFLLSAYKERKVLTDSDNKISLNTIPTCRSLNDLHKLQNEINFVADETCLKIKKEIEEKLNDISKMKENLNKVYMNGIKKRMKRRETHFDELMNTRNILNNKISIVKGEDL